MNKFKTSQVGCITYFDTTIKNSHDSRSYLLLFDVHWDNPKCDRELLLKHLKQAKNTNSGILIGGDLFCLMQGRYDPRRSRKGIRQEHDVPNYLDAVVEDAIKFFKPYAKNILFMGRGNHELSVEKNAETSLLQRLADGLTTHGSSVILGGIGGWWFFRNIAGKKGRQSSVIPTYWHHGHGGGGPVTKGVIQTNRRATYLPDAQFVFSGHIHEAWQIEITRDRINPRNGTRYLDTQTHVSCSTYKQEYLPEESGYHDLNGRPPKPMGGYWFDVSLTPQQKMKAQLIRTIQ